MTKQKAKKVTLIKLGGSIITNKEIPMSLRQATLSRLVGEIAKAKRQLKDELFVVGHGQGSFAHVPATQYKTMDGFVNDESLYGMAIVQDSAAQLNRLVVHEFLRHDIPAVSFYASNTVLTKARKAQNFCSEVLFEYLAKGLLPVTCGDVLVDQAQGCTIWSTEKVLGFFAEAFKERGYEVGRIVHVTEVNGFLDEAGEVVDKIDEDIWPSLKAAIRSTKGFDVTGGMTLKVEESLALAKNKIDSYILSGLKKDNLYHSLVGGNFLGTQIS